MKKKNLKSLSLNKSSISSLYGGLGDPPPVGVESIASCPCEPKKYKPSELTWCLYPVGPCWAL